MSDPRRLSDDALVAIVREFVDYPEALLGHIAALEKENTKLQTIAIDNHDAYEMEKAKVAALEAELKLAIAHDRQPYPTAEAYERVCQILHVERQCTEDLKAEIERLRGAVVALLATRLPSTDPKHVAYADARAVAKSALDATQATP